MKKEKRSLFNAFSDSCINRKEAKECFQNHKKGRACVTGNDLRPASDDENNNEEP